MTERAIQIEKLEKSFRTRNGMTKVVDEISFLIEKGSIAGFIGPNGAGKTTTLKMILDLIKPTSGEILIMGGNPAEKETKEITGYMPEKDAFYKNMYPVEYLVHLGTLSGMKKQDARENAQNLLEELELENAVDRKISNFSSGMKKKIMFAQAIIHNPQVLILDEPTANLDPLAQDQVCRFLKYMQKKGTTVFISSHNIEELEKIIDYVIFINKGKLIMGSDLKELKKKASHGIELKTDDSETAAGILKKRYEVSILDPETLIINAPPSEKKGIINALMNSDVEIHSIDSKKQNLWDIAISLLKQDE